MVTGCDSLATLNLTVASISTSESNITMCTTELPFTWNGLTFTTTESQTATLTSVVNGCDSLATLNLTVASILTSESNITICDTELPFVWNGQTFTMTESQTVLFSSALSGCDSLATLNLTVTPTDFGTTEITICESQLPFIWNGLIFNTGGTQTATLTNADTGCDYLATLNLTVNPSLVNSVEMIICESELPYSWNGVTFNFGGSQIASLTSLVSGCDSLVVMNLTVKPSITSNVEMTICENELPYGWNGLIFTTEGSQTASLTSLLTGCDSLVTLVLSTQETLLSSSDTIVCTSKLPFIWNGLSITDATTYMTILESFMGCDSVVTLNVSTRESADVAFSSSSSIISESSPVIFFYNESYGADNFIWNYGDGNFSTDFEGLHEYNLPLEANYLVTLKAISPDGCEDSSSMEIVYELPGERTYYVPNTFTPNSDEQNPVFKPIFADGFEPLKFEMQIYNRWGELVFMSKDLNSGWDGSVRTNGQNAMYGTYIWNMFFTHPITLDNISHIGHVNLIR